MPRYSLGGGGGDVSATTITVTDNESTDENNVIVFVADADADGGTVALESDGTFHYNPSAGLVTSTAFTGATFDATTDFTVGTTVITDDSIVMTPSTSDTVTIAAATNGVLNVTTVDNAAAAANLNVVVDGAVDVDAAGAINLDAGSGIWTFEDAGTEVLRVTEGNSGDVTVKLVTNAKDLIFTDNGDAEGFRILDGAAGVKVENIELGHATDTTIARSASGVVTIEGSVIKTAVTEDMWIPAAAMRPASTNGCATLTEVETTATRPDMQVLDFDSSTQEYAQFSVAMPKSWNEGTVTAQFYWTHATAVATDVIWGIQGVGVSDNDTIDIAYGTAQTVTDTFHNTAEDLAVSAATSAITLAGTPAAGDLAFFQVYRDADAGGDTTNSTDARLIGVKINYTTNATNDA